MGTFAVHPPPVPMPRLVLAALLLAPLAVAAQPADSLVALPRYSRTVQGNFRPLQTSGSRAVLYSATATGVPILIGTALLLAAPPMRPNGDPTVSGGVGAMLVISGVMVGPPLGNVTLGAGESVQHGVDIMLVGMKVGSGLVVAGAGVLLLAVASGPNSPAADLSLGLIVGGAGVFFGGFAVAGMYSFATIPANARWAREARANGNRVRAREVSVQVAPSYDPRFGAPMATLRVAL